MNFEFSADQMQLKDIARKFLEKEESVKRARNVLEGEASFDEDLWSKIIEMGFTSTAIPEEYGGLGLGYLELCVIAEELGRSLAPTPFSSSVYMATEALLNYGDDSTKQTFLPALASGEKIGAFAHSESNTSPTEANITCSYGSGKLSGTKIAVVDGDVANVFVVTANNGSGVGLYLVDGSTGGTEISPQSTLDPSRSHASVTFNNCEAIELNSDWSDVLNLLDRAAVLFSFEQLGGAEACMDMAKEYAMGRYAFGRSIASFQAIKHKLADMFIAVELARSNCYYGAWALSTDAPELPTAAATCRVSASQAFHECSKENIQTHGGMGFTWEFDCHLYYRRCRQLAANIGSQAIWKDKLIGSLERANQI
ncbi:MAG: acyl-CoA dehydrogenase family protein [Gammaproteobacteria bacterium]